MAAVENELRILDASSTGKSLAFVCASFPEEKLCPPGLREHRLGIEKLSLVYLRSACKCTFHVCQILDWIRVAGQWN